MHLPEKKTGFLPVYNSESRLLILGSFPSVKSREENFYYGNKQNKFWKVLSAFFKLPLPDSIEAKKQLLLQNKIAIWDIVASCHIQGSLDNNIKEYTFVNLLPLLQECNLQAILCNGATAYKFYQKAYSRIDIPCYKMPSTSPANTKFVLQHWLDILQNYLE